MPPDGGVGEAEETGDPAQAGAFGGEPRDLGEEVPALETVVVGEGPDGEAAGAAGTAEALEETAVGWATEAAVACGSPIGLRDVVRASRVGAMGWTKLRLGGVDGWTGLRHGGEKRPVSCRS
jgi:hypothetical protein